MERLTTRLRQLLARPECTVAPGVADALTASEMVDNAGRIVDASGLPEIQQLEERYGVPEDQRAAL